MRELVLGALAACLCLNAVNAVAAELPKKGEIAGKFGWYGNGKVYELEKGHVAFVGEFSGPFIADASSGFMHGATVVCFGVNDVFFDKDSASQGWCVATDVDGDKAYSTWSNRGSALNRPGGDNRWIGGTGKYSGIRGTNKFDTTISPHGAGVSVWHSGTYELR